APVAAGGAATDAAAVDSALTAPAGEISGVLVAEAAGASRGLSRAGAVEEAVGKPRAVAYARVVVLHTSLAVYSEADGSFRISGVPAGMHDLLAEKDEDGDGEADFAALLRDIQVTSDHGRRLGQVRTARPGSISGVVTLDGQPAGNVGVAVFVGGTARVAVTDDSGAWHIPRVAAGLYLVAAQRQGYNVATRDRVEVEAGAETAGVNLALTRETDDARGIVAGVARLVGAGSHAGIRVSLAGGEGAVASALTEADGSFLLTDVPAGQVTLEASASGYAAQSLPGIIVTGGERAFAGVIYLFPGGNPDFDGDAVANDLDPDDDNDGYGDAEEIAAGTDPRGAASIPVGAVAGVAIMDGQPSHENIVVSVSGGVAAVTNASGAYRIERIPAGTVTLFFRRDGFALVTLHDVAIRAGGTAEPPPVTLWPARPLGAITGSVALEGRADASGATVAIAGGGPEAATDATGQYTLGDVPPGRYTLRFSAPGFDPATVADVTVIAGGTFMLQTVTLLSLDAEAPAVAITAPADGEVFRRAALDVTGTCAGLAAGQRLLVNGVEARALAPGFTAWSATVAITEGASRPIEVFVVEPARARAFFAAAVAVRVDLTPPVARALNLPTAIRGYQWPLLVGGEDVVSFRYFLTAVDAANNTEPLSSEIAVGEPFTLRYAFGRRAVLTLIGKDSAGNWQPLAEATRVPLLFIEEEPEENEVAPETTRVTVTQATSAGVTVEWTAAVDDSTGESNLWYRVYAEPAEIRDTRGLAPRLIAEPSDLRADLAGLRPGADWWVAVAAVDEAGNEEAITEENQARVTIPAAPDVTAPAGTRVVAATGGEGVVLLSWTAAADDVDARDALAYRVYAETSPIAGLAGLRPAAITRLGETAATLSGLTSGGRYFLAVTAGDGAGTEEAVTFTNAAEAVAGYPLVSRR
ncbi:MAG: carboxypeptidase regulatory-like domain-containing protein, partial [Planctomycetes bacterium]|nr:carboxypeptidase regulatory-like domain-containing protein [Planctomycetota bacterium]